MLLKKALTKGSIMEKSLVPKQNGWRLGCQRFIFVDHTVIIGLCCLFFIPTEKFGIWQVFKSVGVEYSFSGLT